MPDLRRLNLPPPLDAPREEEALYLQAGMEWVEQNTLYRFCKEEEPPSGVKLFLLKYVEVMISPLASGVQSESLGGMAQSFTGVASAGDILRALAQQLLGGWYSPVQFMPAEQRWR